jgi:hypothetical protein
VELGRIFVVHAQVFARTFTQVEIASETVLRTCADNPHCLLTALTLMARSRLAAVWCRDWVWSVQTHNFNVVEAASVQEIHVEPATIEGAVPFSSSEQTAKVALVSEATGLNNFTWLDGFEGGPPVIALNVQSNEIPEHELSQLRRLPHLMQLSIGGNRFSSITSSSTAYLPSSLLVLDLSFTEGLVFSPGIFVACPQLLQLTIDGCGIVSTTFDEENFEFDSASPLRGCEGTKLAAACRQSIFYGLVNLVNLSMRENAVETTEGFEGLAFFAAQAMHTELLTVAPDLTASDSGAAVLPSCALTHVCVAENPAFETSSELKKFSSWVAATLPSVRTIDHKVLPGHAAPLTNVVDHTSVEYRAARSQQATLSGAGVTDNMEREFTAALRGEKDVATVS